jgi:hypothetical protein
MREGVPLLADGPAVLTARDWRAFWQARGMRELAEVVSLAWAPLGRPGVDRDACLFRIASLLGSRASAKALAEELGRIRHELGDEASAAEDTRAAHAITAWFDEAPRP